MNKLNYRWPAKLKKFGIENSFLKVLVAKYENEIPWQTKVRNEQDLTSFVAEEMLPRQFDRIALPVKPGVRHCYVSSRDVDLDLALDADEGLSDYDKSILLMIRDDDGESEANTALAQLVNERKAAAFRIWGEFLNAKYASDPIFCLLLIRPLLDLSSHGMRRVIISPSIDVSDWLYRRINSGQFSPNDNVAHVYARKLAIGSQTVPDNGWQYIPFGAENATKLAAASVGSGWCVASPDWAADYLSRSCFYILRAAGRPVVALRVSRDKSMVVECQGRYNNSPTSWFVDIDLFTRSQELELASRNRESEMALGEVGNFDEKPSDWWIKRINYWPFALQFIPQGKLAETSQIDFLEIAPYLGFPGIHSLLDQVGLTLDGDAWADIVEADPTRYLNLPPEYLSHPHVVSACKSGFLERAQKGEMTLEDLRCLPQFVKADPDVATAIQDYFPEEIRTRIRRRPKTAVERLSPFDLSVELPASADDPYVVAMEHAVNSLLINDTADFSDAIFPAILRERSDFQQLRSQAWLEAIRRQPPLWYALPLELKYQAEFHPIEGEVARIDLDAWESKVRETPWLLTQERGVPKSIRHHTRILNAYIDGWLPLFEIAPWKVWCKRGLGRRVYASYGILGDPRVFDALVKGWAYFRGKAKLDAAWFSGSRRMREMPVFQLSALMTISDDARAEYVGKQVRVTCEDIASKQDQSLSTEELSAVQKEVRQRLLAMGFMN